jgi:hypothetical protein
MARIWTEEEIKSSLKTDSVVYNGMKHLYQCHMEIECVGQHCHEDSSEGFLDADCERLLPIGQKTSTGQPLSKAELETARKALLNYLPKLTLYANGTSALSKTIKQAQEPADEVIPTPPKSKRRGRQQADPDQLTL